MSISTIPSIAWESSFANTLNIGYLPDNPVSYSKPLEGSVQIRYNDGAADAWTVGTRYFLEFDLRWIPTLDTTNPVATGWDEADGVRLFLEWAKDMNEFRFIPDKDTPGTFILSRLISPINDAPSLEADGTRRLRLVIENTSSPYTGY